MVGSRASGCSRRNFFSTYSYATLEEGDKEKKMTEKEERVRKHAPCRVCGQQDLFFFRCETTGEMICFECFLHLVREEGENLATAQKEGLCGKCGHKHAGDA